MINYKDYIESIPDFPLKGILYRDIQPILENDSVFRNAIKEMGLMVSLPDYWVAVESRGFIFASALSIMFGGGVKLLRKKGKLPNQNLVSEAYGLEYGKDELEISNNENLKNKKVVIVDDIFATGGTLNAAEKLCKKIHLNVTDKLCLVDIGIVKSHNVKCLIKY